MEECTGCNVSGDCWWLMGKGKYSVKLVMGCPCHDCLIKVICEELCEKAFILHPFYSKKDKDL